jgi:hypothetical protein
MVNQLRMILKRYGYVTALQRAARQTFAPEAAVVKQIISALPDKSYLTTLLTSKYFSRADWFI